MPTDYGVLNNSVHWQLKFRCAAARSKELWFPLWKLALSRDLGTFGGL